jgi:predicted nucleic acid-binding protein
VTDAEVAALASGTGYTAYTTDKRLINVIQQTLFLKNVPIQYLAP